MALNPRQAVTLEEHRAMNLTRPLTDQPIGAYTDGRRATGALRSELHTDHSEIPIHEWSPK